MLCKFCPNELNGRRKVTCPACALSLWIILSFVFVLLLVAVGCQPRPVSIHEAGDAMALAGVEAGDPVWVAYADLKGRGFVYTNRGWIPAGRKVTAEDIASAPCEVVVGGKRSYYQHSARTIFLSVDARISTLMHESQHCIDMRAGISDRRELERRAMLSEVGDK